MKLENFKAYIDIKGRLGNQLFQYAFLRTISQNIPISEIFINFKKTYYDNGCWSGNNLIYFKTVEYHECNPTQSCFIEYGNKKQDRLLNIYRNRIVKFVNKANHSLSFIARLAHRILQRNGIYFDDSYFKYYPKIIPKTKNIFIKGYFEYPTLFKNIKPLLIKELSIKKEFLDTKKIQRMMKFAQIENSVCIMYRSWREVDDNIKNQLNIYNLDYYKKAINKMNSLIPKANYIIFSDDIEKAKTIFKFKNVVFENSNLTIPEKFKIMTSCSHIIMCNSTFAWWIQFLNTSENKIVISKNKWSNRPQDKQELLLNEWLKI